MSQAAFLVFGEPDWEVQLGEAGPVERWMELPHAESRMRGFVLLPGEKILSPVFTVDADHCFLVQAIRALSSISVDGLDLTVSLVAQGVSIPLLAVPLTNAVTRDALHEVRFDLRPYAGLVSRIEFRCGPGPAGDPCADWAGLVTLAVAPVDRLSHAKARSQFEWRLANEAGHFTATYRHDLYRKGDERTLSGDTACGSRAAAPDRTGASLRRIEAGAVARRLRSESPREGESAHLFAGRLLSSLIDKPHIDFAARLRNFRPAGDRLRFLSLCSGAARIEAELIRTAGVEVDLTLVDVNDDLLDQAIGRMPPTVRPRCVSGRADELLRVADPPYDIVCFVSGIHHMVELEASLAQIHSVLAPRGELWLIGEQLGRNGNRLWPDARIEADRVFQSLPERLRFNQNTQRIDDRLPDPDFGSASFEGVRSEDIQVAVSRHFVTVEENIRNCFLWRLIDLAYYTNFDMAREDDLDALRMLVAEEYAFFANGGIGCELNGVYRDKLRG